MELRYTAVVLRKKEVGETDRLYTLYTKEQGKVQVTGKGVRKPAAKLAGQLETLTQGLVIVEKGRGRGQISGALAENYFFSVRSDVEALRRVLETTDMFERLVGFDEPDAELFSLLQTFLEQSDVLAVEGKSDKVTLLSEGFLFQLFAHLGYRIETGVCAVSGEKLRPGGRYFFSPDAGGMVSERYGSQAKSVFPVRENTVKLIRLFLGNRLEALPRVQAETKDLREVYQVAQRFYQWILR